MTDTRWLIVQSFSGAEWQAYRGLLTQGVDAYLPHTIASARRNRWDQGVIRPQFPGYLFAGLEGWQKLDHVRKLPGVRDLVRSGAEIVVLSPRQMADIRLRCEEEYRSSVPVRNPIEHYRPGMVIAVPYGPYVGMPVQILDIDNNGHVSASIGSLRVTFRIGAVQQSAHRRRFA